MSTKHWVSQPFVHLFPDPACGHCPPHFSKLYYLLSEKNLPSKLPDSKHLRTFVVGEYDEDDEIAYVGYFVVDLTSGTAHAFRNDQDGVKNVLYNPNVKCLHPVPYRDALGELMLWCVNLPPSHPGNFTQGESGAEFSLDLISKDAYRRMLTEKETEAMVGFTALDASKGYFGIARAPLHA